MEGEEATIEGMKVETGGTEKEAVEHLEMALEKEVDGEGHGEGTLMKL